MAGVEALKRPGPVTDQEAMAPAVSSRASTAPSCTPPPASAFSSFQGMTSREVPPAMCSTEMPRLPMNGTAPIPGPIGPGSDSPWSPAERASSAGSAPKRARTAVVTWAIGFFCSVTTSTQTKQSDLPRRSSRAKASTGSPMAAAR